MGETKNEKKNGGTALLGINVLDLTKSEPGAEATLTLAWMGADVIKVEEPKGKEDPDSMFPQDSTLDRILRADKRLLTLDMTDEKGYAIVTELAKKADIVITDGSPRSVKSRGIDYETIQKINENVIYARINSFPDDSPYVDVQINEGVSQAVGGFSAVTGGTGEPPMVVDFNIGGSVTGINTVIYVLAAVMQRFRTGEGQSIEIFTSNALSTINRGNLGVAAANGKNRPRMGTTMAHISLLDTYPTGDGHWVILFCPPMTEEPWHAFAKAIGQPELIDNPKFKTNKDRCANRAELDAIIKKWMSQYTNIEVMEIMGEHGLVCGAILTADQIMTNEALRNIDVVIDAKDEDGEIYTIPGMPIVTSEAGRPEAKIHSVGEDTDQILKEAGLNSAKIETLRKQGVI